MMPLHRVAQLPLSRDDAVDNGQVPAQLLRTLEILRVRRAFQPRPKHRVQRVVFAIEKPDDLPYHVAVLSGDRDIDTRPQALADRQPQTGIAVTPGVLERPRAGAQWQHIVDHIDRLPGGTSAPVWPKVAGAVILAVFNQRDLRPPVAQIDANVRVVLERPHHRVVARGMTSNELRFEQQRFQLRSHDLSIDRADGLQQPVHLPGVTERLRKIRSHPLPQVLGLADVDHPTIPITHQVHAGLARDAFEQTAVDQGSSSPDMLSWSALADRGHDFQRIEGVNPLASSLRLQSKRHLRGDLGVDAGAVDLARRKTQRSRHPVETRSLQARQHPGRQRQRVDRLVDHLGMPCPLKLRVEKSNVEPDVVPHQHVVADELDDLRRQFAELGGVLNIFIPDTGQLGNVDRNPTSRIEHPVVAIGFLTLSIPDQRNFDHALRGRFQPRRLDIDRHERRKQGFRNLHIQRKSRCQPPRAIGQVLQPLFGFQR